ncbi:MAG: YggT family protein [Pseudomonadota bacterium]|nr:YggT family protein [Pseudomonadota bacterium]MEC8517068.1 YggT family protein [Pseudomonadota bacterium]MED5313827.1 YggT family protein [Pseudomonadota bacterium]MEE3024559.1 YggT family protein [Pseudomonadota bacterium]
MNALIILIDQIVNLYIWTMLAYIVITWLIAFRIINPWQPIVRMAMDFLGRIHEPLMGRVRRFLPDLGGIDLSPIILLLAVQFLRNLVIGFLARLA